MIELFNLPAEIPDNLDRNRPVVVIDIFRASTSITTALASGASQIHVAGSKAEAELLKQKTGGDVVLAGERDGYKIKGYDLGNSPHEMTPDRVSGRPVIFNSTNGTRLLRRFADFKTVAIGSFVSLTSTVAYLSGFDDDPVICCAGREGKFSAEDTLAAGMILYRLGKKPDRLDDAANFARRLVEISNGKWREWARNSFHGRYLASIGLAADLDACLSIDKFDFLPVKSQGVFISSGNI
jgi:2-phosphosulfolactate phosphatase